MASLRLGDMLISSFLPSAGGQGSEQRHFSLTVRQRGRILWGRPLCIIIITKATKRHVKETLPTLYQNWIFLVTVAMIAAVAADLCTSWEVLRAHSSMPMQLIQQKCSELTLHQAVHTVLLIKFHYLIPPASLAPATATLSAFFKIGGTKVFLCKIESKLYYFKHINP